jgi:hypothetical protein
LRSRSEGPAHARWRSGRPLSQMWPRLRKPCEMVRRETPARRRAGATPSSRHGGAYCGAD